MFLKPGGDAFFWVYAPVAIPSILSGYFLLGTPITALVTRIASPLLSVLLRLPPTCCAARSCRRRTGTASPPRA
ncbi:MAG: hypothetical protein QM783_16450 [Phycisphaerales bacterium]